MDKVEDIVGRLRWDSTYCRDRIGDTIRGIGRDCSEAADLIQSQQALIEEMREALTFYSDVSKYPAPLTGGMGALWEDCGAVARKTLSQKDQIDGY